MTEQFVSIGVDSLILGEPLPASIYVFIQGRFILLRSEGDAITPKLFDRFRRRKVEHVFVQNSDLTHIQHWVEVNNTLLKLPISSFPLVELRQRSVQELKNLFDIEEGKEVCLQTVKPFFEAAHSIVKDLLNSPVTTIPLNQLQTYSVSVLEHSINVAFLSTYLASQMGYNHRRILELIALGALLHDVGKPAIKTRETDDEDKIEQLMRQHPELGSRTTDHLGSNLPIEVQMIIAQHHEYDDGTGFPRGLKGSAIFDLARIVCIANFYDELVRGSSGAWGHRQRSALHLLKTEYEHLFDSAKLEKVVHVLEKSIAAEA